MICVLSAAQWGPLAADHAARVESLTAQVRDRRRRGRADPVEDFLFTYYSHRPALLRRWHPGIGTGLLDAPEHAGWRLYRDDAGVVAVDGEEAVRRLGTTARFVGSLVDSTAGRRPALDCFGLHEWAMVYRAGQVRHADWPLRLGASGTDEVVEQHTVRCSHYDAFRFFTDEARDRNTLQPSRARQVALEQPGCLHAGMDLYKWAYKLVPVVSSDLLLDCFRLARDVRVLDMRASPYDLTELGYEPVRIEDAAGKAEYVRGQREFMDRAQQLRARLSAVCTELLGSEESGARR